MTELMKNENGVTLLQAIIVLAIIGILGAIFVPDQHKSDKKSETRKESTKKDDRTVIKNKIRDIEDDYIEKVDLTLFDNDKYSANIFYSRDSALSASSYIFSAGQDVMEISHEIMEQWPEKITRLVYFIRAPTQDKYGNQGSSLAIKLFYKANDLNKINWDNFTNWQMLNITSDMEIKPLGRSMIAKYCQDTGNAKYSGDFCRQALNNY